MRLIVINRLTVLGASKIFTLQLIKPKFIGNNNLKKTKFHAYYKN